MFFDPVWGPRHGKSGVGFIEAVPGKGKSYTAGVMAYNSFKIGYDVYMFDPTGAVLDLIELPDVAPYARHIDLSGAEAGVLNPYTLVPDPDPADFAEGEEHKLNQARAETRAERRDSTVDTLVGLLPERVAGQLSLLELAVSKVDDSVDGSPWNVVAELERAAPSRDGEHSVAAYGPAGLNLAVQLRAASEMKGGVLVFPTEGSTTAPRLASPARFTLVTMRDIDPPEGEPTTRQERIALTVLRLASRFTQRAMYADRKPKVIITDEVGIVGAGASAFKAFLNRASRDSRKRFTCLAMLGQNPSDLSGLGEDIANLVGWMLVGGMDSMKAATAACEALGVPLGHGYENTILNLDRGEWIMRDYKKRVELITVLGRHLPHVDAALATDPGQVDAEGPMTAVAMTGDEWDERRLAVGASA